MSVTAPVSFPFPSAATITIVEHAHVSDHLDDHELGGSSHAIYNEA
jgi:hypothetical protein